MNINEYIEHLTSAPADEKPLDRMVDGGGLTSIFRTIAVIGDSLSSGEFQAMNKEGTKWSYHDMFEYSWGQYIAREAGCTVYNFSRGGMTAMEYMKSFGANQSFFDVKKAAQAYIIALGVNDLINRKFELGKLGDTWDGNVAVDMAQDKTTFCAFYCALIERYKEIQPDAKFFLMSMPKGTGEKPEDDEKRAAHNALLHELAGKYKNTYVIDLYTYMPANAGDYRKLFYLAGHLNPMGYMFTAKVVMSYIDYIIRHNYEDFIQVPFIGTGTHHYGAKW